MSAATAKKPPAAGVGRVSSTDPASPSASPARTPSRSSTPTTAPAARRGPPRTTTPVSARAAAHARRGSTMSNSNVTISTEAEEAARAETVALLDDLKERLSNAEISSEQYRKQAEVLQTRLDDALKESAKLEEKVHETEEQIETLRNEKRETARQMREMETIYEAERSSMNKEKEEMSNREEEMQTIIQRLKDTLSQRMSDEEGRSSRQSAATSPNVDNGSFAPPSSLNRSDSRNNSKLLLQKDKLIESLRLELAEAQIKLVESENQGGGRLQEVERLLMEARMANARLMEDNESYQLLLQEKTLNGDFSKNDFSYMNVSANQDALNALEGRSGGTSLADELSEASEGADNNDNVRRLETELKSMKDQNKALTLYINKIIERLLQHQDFEHILDTSSEPKPLAANTNKELPPPPDKGASGASLLQRAKTMAVGPNKTRPRPMSYMPSAQPANSAHTDPETAPRIPIGNLTRSSSTRRSRPMSEQFTGVNLVSQMYKGPDGPISPPLGSPRTPRTSQTFFGGNPNAAARAPSGQQAPTAGNFPGMRSETSSLSGDSGELTTPPSQSPPRSHHEKQTTFAGNKPRPLRLVQENAEKQENNKRSSWMGWASGWGKKDEPAAAANSEAIPE
ncbi:m serotype [Colletotrichum truncatum]|uniref:M serotype n=1 Tax=Colletotrichum truncatum TaxID=5467 RepID=A0ACC3ZEM6_COLTU|nr:m serotype [Colletotrichum truncatum]KAF6801452.1 m serotype [Colletotrichum truncatum]